MVPASVPDPVRDCRCEQHNGSSGQVLVRCEPGQNGSIEQTFAIQVGTSYFKNYVLYVKIKSLIFEDMIKKSEQDCSILLLMLLYSHNSVAAAVFRVSG